MLATSPMQLSHDQRACVEFRPDTPLLVKGIPGSGKSTVIVARANRLMREPRTAPSGAVPMVRIFTFNRMLAEYVRSLAAQLNGSPPLVDNFHAWARAALKEMGESRHTIDEETVAALLGKVLKEVRESKPASKLLDSELDFWVDEVRWIKGRGLLDRERYLAADRVGRGTAIRVRASERKMIWTVFERYQALLAQRNLWDHNDLAIEILRRRDSLPFEFRAEHVLIDEAQDLQPAAIMAIRASAYRSITLAADKAQNIYPTRFRWVDIGIDIVGRSKSLKRSYRTTRAIA